MARPDTTDAQGQPALTSMSENSTRTPPVDSRAVAWKNAPASGVVTARLAVP